MTYRTPFPPLEVDCIDAIITSFALLLLIESTMASDLNIPYALYQVNIANCFAFNSHIG